MSLKKSWNRNVVIMGAVGITILIVFATTYMMPIPNIATGFSLLSLFFWGMSVRSLLAQRKPLRKLKTLRKQTGLRRGQVNEEDREHALQDMGSDDAYKPGILGSGARLRSDRSKDED